MIAKRIGILFCMLLLAGCAGGAPYSTPFTGVGGKELVGTLFGATAGGIAGSQIGSGSGQLWATGAGVLAGAAAGNVIGSRLDRADREYEARAQQMAMRAPAGQPVRWHNPSTGHGGEVMTRREGHTPDGRYCREYVSTVYIDGRRQSATGAACRLSDGRWHIGPY